MGLTVFEGLGTGLEELGVVVTTLTADFRSLASGSPIGT